MITQLDERLWFPNPYLGESNGFIAVGGDLSVDRLLLAYSNGFFPWFSFHDCPEPHWYCPLERFVIFPSEIHVSHSMKQMMRQEKYRVSYNQDFEGVIKGCSTVDERNLEEGAWLGREMIKAYTELHRQGYASSVEVWETQGADAPKLVGGLYGVEIGNAFFGESMFSLVPSASKLALIFLAESIKSRGGAFIDCQFETPHLRSMGGRHIPYDEYMQLLNQDKP